MDDMKMEIDAVMQMEQVTSTTSMKAFKQIPHTAGYPMPPSSFLPLSFDLPSEDDLLLDEIPFNDPTDIGDPAIENLPPYSLYRTPSDAWVQRGKEILASNQQRLAHAHRHVKDPEQRVTIVTALFDLGRANQTSAQFRVTFEEYLQRFQHTMDVNFPMVVFMDPHHVSLLNLASHTNGVVIIPWSIQHLVEAYPTYAHRIERIRESAIYTKQTNSSGWLQYTPQASIKHYNLLVMSKPFLLRWAAKVNPWRTQYVMFVDAGHGCIGALKPDHLDLMRHLMGRMMVTYFVFNVGVTSETNGMPQKAMRHYIGPPHNNEATWDNDECCNIVRGGIFGGTPAYIDVFAQIYNHALSQTLSDGYMGTDENVLAMTVARFPQLFNAYHNVRDNCDLFVDSGEKAEVDKGVYVQGAEPDVWNGTAYVRQAGRYEKVVVKDHRVKG